MQLGKELAAGFVSDDAHAAADAEAGLPPDVVEANAPQEPAAPEPEPSAAG